MTSWSIYPLNLPTHSSISDHSLAHPADTNRLHPLPSSQLAVNAAGMKRLLRVSQSLGAVDSQGPQMHSEAFCLCIVVGCFGFFHFSFEGKELLVQLWEIWGKQPLIRWLMPFSPAHVHHLQRKQLLWLRASVGASFPHGLSSLRVRKGYLLHGSSLTIPVERHRTSIHFQPLSGLDCSHPR